MRPMIGPDQAEPVHLLEGQHPAEEGDEAEAARVRRPRAEQGGVPQGDPGGGEIERGLGGLDETPLPRERARVRGPAHRDEAEHRQRHHRGRAEEREPPRGRERRHRGQPARRRRQQAEEEEQRARVREDRAGLAIPAGVEIQDRIAGHGEQRHRDQDQQPEPECPGRVGEGPLHDGRRRGRQPAAARAGVALRVPEKRPTCVSRIAANVARTPHLPGMAGAGPGMIGPRPCAGLPGLSRSRSASWLPFLPRRSSSSRPVRSRPSRSGR